MARGGYRAGAGRPKGAKSTKVKAKKAAPRKRASKAADVEIPQDVADAAVAEGLNPLDYMLQVMRDPKQSAADRMRMAVAAAPFVHPRAGEAKPGKKEVQATAASKATKSKFAPAAPPLQLVRT